MNDREAMQLALRCAHSVEGRTSPRPPVGAVIVQNGEVVGQGATSPPYGPHAEVHALQEAGEAAPGATLYTTLEPCCVMVHTPPCTKAIIAAGIQRVVIGSLDPNPLVYQQGVEQLRAAGIEVEIGVESDETDEVIRPFATYVLKKRPYVTAKWAMTLDGKIATRMKDAYWISGSESRVWVHNLRDRVDAILVGSGTVRADNPQLTVRLSEEQRMYARTPRRGPLRVVLATQGDIPETLALLQDGLAVGTCLIVGENCVRERTQQLQERGVDVVQVAVDAQGKVDLVVALQALAQRGVMHVLIEGGAGVLGSAFDRALIDHVAVFIAPTLVGGVLAPSPIGGIGLDIMKCAARLQRMRTQTSGEDILIEGDVVYT